jgi:hypothetical protein
MAAHPQCFSGSYLEFDFRRHNRITGSQVCWMVIQRRDAGLPRVRSAHLRVSSMESSEFLRPGESPAQNDFLSACLRSPPTRSRPLRQRPARNSHRPCATHIRWVDAANDSGDSRSVRRDPNPRAACDSPSSIPHASRSDGCRGRGHRDAPGQVRHPAKNSSQCRKSQCLANGIHVFSCSKGNLDSSRRRVCPVIPLLTETVNSLGSFHLQLFLNPASTRNPSGQWLAA